MKHIREFPYPNTPEHLKDRVDLLAKIMAGVLVQEKLPAVPATWDDLPKWALHPCWLHAAKWSDGKQYKKIRYRGHVFYIHRVMCELVNGPIPEGYLVDHLCKVHGCCQPRHLEAVPTKVNTLRGDNPNWMMRQAVKEALFHEHYVIEGKLGDVDVKLETPRLASSTQEKPEFWTTPDLLQAHIDHGHPRFREPLTGVNEEYKPAVRLQPAYFFPVEETLVIVDPGVVDPCVAPHPFGARSDGSWRGLRLTDIPADHVVVAERVREANKRDGEQRAAPRGPERLAELQQEKLAELQQEKLAKARRRWRWLREFAGSFSRWRGAP